MRSSRSCSPRFHARNPRRIRDRLRSPRPNRIENRIFSSRQWQADARLLPGNGRDIHPDFPLLRQTLPGHCLDLVEGHFDALVRRESSLKLAICMPLGIASAFAQQPARCEVDKARFVVGEPYSRELAERAGRAAGARSTRKLEPGMPATTDLREDRLNLQVDGQGVVDHVTCG